MDIEKDPRENATFNTEPRWARPQSNGWSTKSSIKFILAVVLLGSLGINVLHAIRSALAIATLGSHLPNWTELHGGSNLDIEDSAHAAAANETWQFSAWQKTGCTVEPASRNGEGIQACEAINGDQSYISLSVPSLAAGLRLCFYSDDACTKDATSITTRTGCSPLAASSTYFFVKFSGEAC